MNNLTEKQKQLIGWLITVIAVVVAGYFGVTYPIPDPPSAIEPAEEAVTLGITNFDQIQLDGTTDPVLDLTGNCLDLDDDGDTSLCADTDDEIDIEVAGADDFTIKANNFELVSGSVVDINGSADGLVLDADADTSISADTDDVAIFEVQSDDILRLENNTGGAHSYILAQDQTHLIQREVFATFDDFLYQTITEADTPWILNSGSDTEAIDPAINAQEEGVIRVTTGDAGTGVAADGSQLIAHIPVQADSGGLVFETRLHINTAVTDLQLCLGLTDSTSLELPASISGTTITTNATDAVLFCYDTAATTDEWYAIGVDTDVDATGNAITGVAPTADTYQTFRIEVDADGETARLYIDGTLEVSLTAAATAAAVNLHATVVADATTTTSKTVDVDYIYVGHTR